MQRQGEGYGAAEGEAEGKEARARRAKASMADALTCRVGRRGSGGVSGH